MDRKLYHPRVLILSTTVVHLKGDVEFMERVSMVENSKYKYYFYQTTTSFCNTTKLTLRECAGDKNSVSHSKISVSQAKAIATVEESK